MSRLSQPATLLGEAPACRLHWRVSPFLPFCGHFHQVLFFRTIGFGGELSASLRVSPIFGYFIHSRHLQLPSASGIERNPGSRRDQFKRVCSSISLDADSNEARADQTVRRTRRAL